MILSLTRFKQIITDHCICASCRAKALVSVKMQEFQYIYRCISTLALIWMSFVRSIPIPFISNVTLVPGTIINSTILHNVTCDQCLCQTAPTHSILNCFPNSSCQFFLTTPLRYQIASLPQARLFFPNSQLPSKSQCCMPNTTELINKLQNGTRTTVSVSQPRCLSLKNPHEIYTVNRTNGQLLGYSANNLSNILSLTLSVSDPISLTQNHGHSYISRGSNSVIIVDDNSRTTVGVINSNLFNGSRDILFLNGGEIMVVASTFGQSLVFFKRMNNSPVNYTFLFNQVFPSVHPHGLFYINDSFFYASS